MKKAEFKKIIEIYYDLCNSDDGLFFDERKAITDKAYEVIVDPLQKAGNPEWKKLDRLLGEYAAECEEQAFVSGFVYAMQLKEECNLLSTAKAVQG